ncbi:cytidine deaminase [Beijerinckia indica]|uniref:Cytidine deaminase n=1 Tax=Beijerinckia indica subsp. indica (strain ATCC 9039 / DSM 1715 / NCIMB 8712) TaxID=395963 RepID=B2IC63_BEII9|nr:cytidine deaminase [Beijerinckia indica]ACB96660.1 cytidine deaminase [Beijerinckia indica subsp. indica ATCC 9039]
MDPLEELWSAALAVFDRAYAPYSRFKVAAAVRSVSGAVFVGVNVENAAYPVGTCAEAGAIAAMITAGERSIDAIFILGDGAGHTTPCGACRQRLHEFSAPETLVHVGGPEGHRATYTMAELLPHGFALDRPRDADEQD